MIYLKNNSKSLFFYKGTSRKDLAEGFRGRISSIVARFCGRIPRKDPRKDSWKDPFRCYLKDNFFKVATSAEGFSEGSAEGFRGTISSMVARFCGRIPRKDPRKDPFRC